MLQRVKNPSSIVTAVAWVRSLAQELLHAAGVAKKKKIQDIPEKRKYTFIEKYREKDHEMDFCFTVYWAIWSSLILSTSSRVISVR